MMLLQEHPEILITFSVQILVDKVIFKVLSHVYFNENTANSTKHTLKDALLCDVPD